MYFAGGKTKNGRMFVKISGMRCVMCRNQQIQNLKGKREKTKEAINCTKHLTSLFVISKACCTVTINRDTLNLTHELLEVRPYS